MFKKNFSLILTSISFLILFYITYKSEIIFSGTKRDYYFIYYIFSFLILIFAILTFFFNDKVKEYLIIIFTTTLVGLYFFEGYLTFKWGKIGNIYKKETGKKYDTRTKLEIYEDLKKKNKNIKIIVPPTIYLKKNDSLFPLSGISKSRTIYCNENGYFSIDWSDRYGFNNPDNEWDEEKIEYVLVGDSFTHGACVNRPDDMASVLRKLSKKPVLNMGYGGNGPLIELATLREYLGSNVKKILWIYYPNDLPELNKELKSIILKKYLNNQSFTQNLKSKQNEINQIANKYLFWSAEREKKNLRFLKLTEIRKILNFYLPKKNQPNAPLPKPIDEFSKILEMTNNLAKKNNSKLYFVYLPEYWQFVEKNYDNTDYLQIKRVLKKLNIPLIDIYKEVFEKEENPLSLFPFELYGHYNVLGYNKISKVIFKKTQD